MYARGATPETSAPFAFVRAFPAAMPATCVPCSALEASASKGSSALPVCPGAGNVRATITFALVKARCPFG